MQNPHGISLVSPGAKTTGDSTAATRSKPAACPVIFAGSGRSAVPGIRLIFTVIGLDTIYTPNKDGPSDNNVIGTNKLNYSPESFSDECAFSTPTTPQHVASVLNLKVRLAFDSHFTAGRSLSLMFRKILRHDDPATR